MNTILTRNIVFVPVASLVVLAVAALCVSPASAALTYHWKLDETTGDVAVDTQGNQDGTLVNSPTWVPAGGRIDGALDFELDDSEYVDLGTDPLLGNLFTLMAWVKGESFSGKNVMFSQYNSITVSGSFYCGAEDGKLTMYQKFGPGTLTGTTTLDPDQWYHMAFVKGNWGLGVGYLNGEQEVYTGDMIDMSTSPNIQVQLGSRTMFSPLLWDGLIDDVRIYDEVLSVEEIRGIAGLRHPGDADNSGTVDADDAAILASNWLQSGKAWADGDFNEDTIVDDKDATIMAVNWGWSFGESAAAAVPEPGTIVLLLGGILTVLMARRK